MDKASQLSRLKTQVLKDKTLPLRESANNLVFGEGNPNSKIIFLGEAPGKMEDLSGRPFVGRAGKLLEKLLGSIGLKREDVWISSLLYFRPPENRPPTPKEVLIFSKYVDEQIKIINPKVVVTLGRFSLSKFLPKAKITQVHGNSQNLEFSGKTFKILPMYHPAAGLRSSDVLNKLEADFKKNGKFLSRT